MNNQEDKNTTGPEMRKKVASKKDIGKPSEEQEDDFEFGAKLQIPAAIRKEIASKGLVPRFVSTKKIVESGGYHPNGWVPYQIENPVKNPITGQADSIFRVGDLVLAVKTKQQHARQTQYLRDKAENQQKAQKNSVKEMRDRIKDSRADKHISLIEGYEENDGDDNE